MNNQYTCINAVFTHQQKLLFTQLPVKNETYTLKEEVKSSIDDKVGYIFYELSNPSHSNGQEYSFRHSRFRKLEDIDNQVEQLVDTLEYQ